eukprot:TRINITY_DN10597_c0_g3_i1.p1 TRINITY_DN10597_c0_g3~~TRINITY_DN10597_c0_g3_i1.p1  ORF type:complete len:615 (+),score=176.37 TRINITY_DN10597_c0_g3_i1:1518-3362(+)
MCLTRREGCLTRRTAAATTRCKFSGRITSPTAKTCASPRSPQPRSRSPLYLSARDPACRSASAATATPRGCPLKCTVQLSKKVNGRCNVGGEVLGGGQLEALGGRARMSENAAKVGTMAVLPSDVDDWFRVCVELNDEKFTSVEKADLDKYLQNPLQAANVVVHVIVNGSLKYVVQPPANIAGNIWDIGFVNPMNGDLLAVNSITDTSPATRLDNFKDFLSLYAYISLKPDLRNSFGFARGGTQKLDDMVMGQEDFGTITATSADIPKDSEGEFRKKFVNSVSDMFGNASLKALSRLVNLNRGQVAEGEYGRTLWSTTLGANKKVTFGFLRGYAYKKPASPRKEREEILIKDKEEDEVRDFERREIEEPVREEYKPIYIPVRSVNQDGLSSQRRENLDSRRREDSGEQHEDSDDQQQSQDDKLQDLEEHKQEEYKEDKEESEQKDQKGQKGQDDQEDNSHKDHSQEDDHKEDEEQEKANSHEEDEGQKEDKRSAHSSEKQSSKLEESRKEESEKEGEREEYGQERFEEANSQKEKSEHEKSKHEESKHESEQAVDKSKEEQKSEEDSSDAELDDLMQGEAITKTAKVAHTEQLLERKKKTMEEKYEYDRDNEDA